MAHRKQHSSDLFIVLILFFVYAGSALMLGVLGVTSYSRTVDVLQEGSDERSGILYLAQKVQQNDIGGGVRLDQYQGNDALVLIEQETGEGFETWIFIQDGYLCEQLIAADSEIIPDQAQRIMPIKALSLTLEAHNLLSMSVTSTSDTVDTLSLALQSSGESFNSGDTPPSNLSATEPQGPTVMSPTAFEGGEG